MSWFETRSSQGAGNKRRKLGYLLITKSQEYFITRYLGFRSAMGSSSLGSAQKVISAAATPMQWAGMQRSLGLRSYILLTMMFLY